MNVLGTLEARFEQWLSQPVPNAAGRIGLARIVYCLFSLWLFSRLYLVESAGRAVLQWNPPTVFSWLPPPSPELLLVGESLLIGVVVLLLLGYQVRLMTLALLGLGLFWGAFKTSAFTLDRVSALMLVLVPLIMLFSEWGSTYSLDALLKRRRGQPVPAPSDSDWRYAWPAKTLLVLMAFLFFTSGYYKLAAGDWLRYDNWIQGLLFSKSVHSYLQNGTPMHPVAILLSSVPWLATLSQYGIMLFEISFPLALFSRFIRRTYLRLLPLFHVFNAYVLGILFPYVIGAYPFYVDWQKLRPDRLKLPLLERAPAPLLVGGTVLLAGIIALLWNTTRIPRTIFGLGGILNNNYGIWGVIFAGWAIWNLVELISWLRQRRAHDGALADEASLRPG